MTRAFVAAVACFALPAYAQTAALSGVPDDGIPDVYYFAVDGETLTTRGLISRSAGTLVLDTDGMDFVWISVGGADVSQSPDCDLCDDGVLPNLNLPPFFISEYSVTGSSLDTVWEMTNPVTPGFVGVVAEFDDDECGFGDPRCPEFGLANYGDSAEFNRIHDDGNGNFWHVRFESFNQGDVFTDVTVVPEPPIIPAAYVLCMFCVISLRRAP